MREREREDLVLNLKVFGFNEKVKNRGRLFDGGDDELGERERESFGNRECVKWKPKNK